MAAGIGLEFDVLICFGFGLVTPFPKTLVAPQVRCLFWVCESATSRSCLNEFDLPYAWSPSKKTT